MLKKGTISRVGCFYLKTPEYKDDVIRAIGEFFKDSIYKQTRASLLFRTPQEEEFFNEWFLYDFRFSDNKGMLEKYYYENPENLPEYRRAIYKDLMENYFGLYEVLEIRPFTGLKIKRLEDSKVFDVYEMSLTTQVEVGDLFFGRVASVGDRYELVGSDSMSFKLSTLPEQQRIIYTKKFSKFKNMTPTDALNIIRNPMDI